MLLKAVVQTIPTFAMSCFKLPVSLCQDIECSFASFGGVKGEIGEKFTRINRRYILCKPEMEGGLAFKDLCKFNEAMLAKQAWRLVHDTGSFYRVFKTKYFRNCSIF